jgi:hypothetical protein
VIQVENQLEKFYRFVRSDVLLTTCRTRIIIIIIISLLQSTAGHRPLQFLASIGGFAHNRHAGQAGWQSQGVAPHPGDAAARHRSVVFSYACFGWLYRHQSVAKTSFVEQQDVPRAGEVGLGRDAVLTLDTSKKNRDMS